MCTHVIIIIINYISIAPFPEKKTSSERFTITTFLKVEIYDKNRLTDVLLPLAVNSKSAEKVDSLPLLGLNPAIFSTPVHRSDHTAKSYPLF
jgi:hypothetical protein